MRSTSVLGLAALAALLPAAPAFSAAVQIDAGNTALLFGGTDAEGGIGDWYVSNGVVEAIIDDVGPVPDLIGVVPPGTEPPIQSSVNPTGGTIIDLGRVGEHNDQLAQMFTVGGLSTSNFILYDTITTPGPNTVRASGKLLLPPVSVAPAPCVDVQTDYTAAGSDPFLTVTSTATNNCPVTATGFGGFLDAFIWTQRGLIPFSGGGLGFNHPVLNLSNPVLALEFPAFMSAPGTVRPADGVMDTASGTPSGEVSYGLVGVLVEVDPDGPGGAPPAISRSIDSLFGVSSTLVSALGNQPAIVPSSGGLVSGGTLVYTRRIHVGAKNDVRSGGDAMVTDLMGRAGFPTGTVSGDVDAADTPDVEASIVLRLLNGRCQLDTSVSCRVNADCNLPPNVGPCAPIAPGFAVGGTVSHVRTDATGAFGGVVLPQGEYEVRVLSPERDDVLVSPVVVGPGNTVLPIPALTGRGTVVFRTRERRPGMPLVPAKLTFKGVDGTPDPRFARDLAATLGGNDIQPESFGGTQAGTAGHAAGQGNVVYTATGQGDIQVRPGTYDVYVSRGMEYNVAARRITVAEGGTAAVDVVLKRVLRTRGAVSADFHVHSARSFDASAPLRDRVAAFAAEGVEVMVSTEHDKNADYAPVIAGLGLAPLLRSIVGSEITGSVPNPPVFPQSFGHINAWPLPFAPDAPRDGAIHDEYVAPNWIYKRLRDAGAEVIQYNHPRAGVSGLTSIGIFNNIGCNRCANAIDTPCVVDADCPASPAPQDCTCVGYQPDRPITMAPNDILLDDGVLGPGSVPNPDGLTNLDFDVMEIANGAKQGDVRGLREMRRDWLSFLNQGIFKPGTGVSDSHRITVEHAGWARTYVFGVGDDPAALDVGAFNAAVKAGRMLIAAGPYVDVLAITGSGRAAPGDLIGTRRRVVLRIRVHSPAWLPVEEVRVIANGQVVASFDETTRPRVRPLPARFDSVGGTRRFSALLHLFPEQDTYYVVEAGAKLPADPNTPPPSPPIVDIVAPEVVPFSITNPIFVDRDGNGVFDPPGLPVMVARGPAASPSAVAAVDPAAEAPGVWERLRSGLARLASRLGGEVAAQPLPGEMTGVTREEKAEATRKGEYFPLHDFKIPLDALDEVERRRQAAERGLAPEEVPPREAGK